MIIIWGTRTRQERLGTVADWCPACQRARAFTVTNYFRVGHIYYIPLGQGTFVATVRECWECGSQYHCAEEDYDEFLPEDAVEQMSMNELLQQTNWSLKERMEAHRRPPVEPRARPDSRNNDTDIPYASPADDGVSPA